VKLVVDVRRCEGHGLCAEAAPGLFEINDDGDLVVLMDGDQVPEGQRDAAAAAARVCPVGALMVELER
jgi:ferredoxin